MHQRIWMKCSPRFALHDADPSAARLHPAARTQALFRTTSEFIRSRRQHMKIITLIPAVLFMAAPGANAVDYVKCEAINKAAARLNVTAKQKQMLPGLQPSTQTMKNIVGSVR